MNKLIRDALLLNPNAREVARQLNIPVHRVYYFARVRKIRLRTAGRPKKHNYNEKSLLSKIKDALKTRGGLVQLSKKLKIPYYVVTNASKKLKLAS
jgi:hypothetical protein